MDELVRFGLIVGTCTVLPVALRAVTQLIIVVWSLRADRAGRAHAIHLLKTIGVPARPNPVNRDAGDNAASARNDHG